MAAITALCACVYLLCESAGINGRTAPEVALTALFNHIFNSVAVRLETQEAFKTTETGFNRLQAKCWKENTVIQK